ncbi:MAG: hypothetical protein ACD_79C01240G0002 [uncultured bacterium]|nr:MAG: hypothetical protein ACD_79C01240G0002 [uncultured bacterium]
MLNQLSLKTKLIGGFLILIILSVISGAISVSGIKSLKESTDFLTDRLTTSNLAQELSFYGIKLYQNQADMIINENLDTVKIYEKTMENFDSIKEKLKEKMDTAEEKEWINEIHKNDSELDVLFHSKITEEVKHKLENLIQQYDDKSDELIGALEEKADKIIASVNEELNDALSKSNDEILNERIRQLIAVSNLKYWSIKLYQNQADLIINQNMDSIKTFEESSMKKNEYLELSRKAVDTEEEKTWLKEIEKLDAEFHAQFKEKIVPEVSRILEKRIQKYDGESDELISELDVNIQKIITSLQSEAEEALSNFNSVSTKVREQVLVFIVCGTLFGLFVGIFLSRSISNAITTVSSALKLGSEQVTNASGQIAQTSQSMAEGASEQASSLEEISSSLEEMSSMTKQNAENANQANIIASDAKSASEDGNIAMKKMADAITEIKNSSDATAKIIKTIDEIAFQTNLLALNAAVEAARAGEAGKGFAVVAEEVRNLAQRSAEAAKNTSALIEQSQKNSDNGVKVTSEVAGILTKITESTNKVSNLIGEVSQATREQAQGIDQINTAVAQMDKVTQSNASSSEESASASEELSGQAIELHELVNVLVSVVDGDKSNNSHSYDENFNHSSYKPGEIRSVPKNKINYVPRENKNKQLQKNTLKVSDKKRIIKSNAIVNLDESDFKEF